MHNRFHILSIFTILFLVGIIFGGCDESGEGGSGSISLLEGEPAILDSVLAINVSDDRPDGITDIFFDTSERIYLWVFWGNVKGRHTVEVRWFSPEEAVDDPPFRDEELTFTSSSGDEITWFFVDPPSTGFPQKIHKRTNLLVDFLGKY